MTLVLALEGTDGLLLAADSRGTIGDPRGLTAIADDHQKLFKLSRHCGVVLAGAAELSSTFIDELVRVLESENLEHADAIMNRARDLIRDRYGDWFSRVAPERRADIVFILAGLQPFGDDDLRPRIHLLASGLDFAPQLCRTGRMMAGVPQYATYLVHRLYDRNMRISDLKRLAAYLIAETATQDPKVGGPIKMAQITPSDGYADISEREVAKIVGANERLNRQLRKVFYTGQSTA